ncbi:MAG: lysylphosphatidylglycerol synthase transmembrane domain-containing protein [Oligoflexales bacterium]
MKNPILKFFKYLIRPAITICLIYWLIQSGKLDPKFFWILWAQPHLFLTSILLWLGASLLLSAWRWRVLLKGAGSDVPTKLVLLLTSAGLFFNSVMPGAVGGDVLKGWYVYKYHQAKSRHAVLLTVLLDRVLGVMALFILGACASMVGLWTGKMPGYLLGWCGMTLGLGMGLALGLFCISIGWVPFGTMLQRIEIFKKCIRAVQMQDGKAIFRATLISLCVQITNLFGYWVFTQASFSGIIPWTSVFIILPFAVLSTALPLAPGGAGVGHLSFEFFFQQIGMEGGANIFNLYFVGQMTLNLTGGVAFLFLKKQMVNLKE